MQLCINVQNDWNGSLKAVPVGPNGIVLREVGDDDDLYVSSVVLWMKRLAGQPTPTILLQALERDSDPAVLVNKLVWQMQPAADGGRPEFSKHFDPPIHVPGGHNLVLRTAGTSSPDPEVGYSLLCELI